MFTVVWGTYLTHRTQNVFVCSQDTLLPTPANFHYVFNLRDLSRIWQGMVGTMSSVIVDRPVLLSLWKHECHRVIADRLTTAKDVQWFEETLVNVVQDNIGEEFVDIVKPTNYFVDFLRSEDASHTFA